MSQLRGSVLGLVALAALSQSCMSPGLIVEQSRGGRANADGSPLASLRDDGLLAVVTLGSSGCPTEPVAATADGPHRLVVTLRSRRPAGDAVCTDDLAPTRSVIRLPGDISAPPLTVDFRGEGYGVPSVSRVLPSPSRPR